MIRFFGMLPICDLKCMNYKSEDSRLSILYIKLNVVCMFAIHFISFKPGSVKLGWMLEYHLEQDVISYVRHRVSSRDCHAYANSSSPSVIR